MFNLVLFGDSVIDNGPYLKSGQPDVTAQVRKALGGEWTVERRAIDGATIEEVQARQVKPAPAAEAMVLSVGGNNLLQLREKLLTDDLQSMTQALETLHRVQNVFSETYGRLLDELKQYGVPLLALTIYNPRFETKEGYPTEFQAAAETAVALFNDAIQLELRRRSIDVLDLRLVTTDDSDFANPIEPSMLGGAKIADAIAAWINSL